jgi:hypothetical protein
MSKHVNRFFCSFTGKSPVTFFCLVTVDLPVTFFWGRNLQLSATYAPRVFCFSPPSFFWVPPVTSGNFWLFQP